MSRNRRLARRPARTVVAARGPGDLVCAVPYLLGFTPTASIVLVSLRGPRLRFGLVARLDLPDVQEHDEVGYQAQASRVAEALCSFVRRDRPREVVAMIFDERPWAPTQRPWQQLVDEIVSELALQGLPLREALYVTSQRFWSYTCAQDGCCPDAGQARADTASSPLAAAYVLAGRSPLADRQTLAARVAPAGPVTTAAVESVLASALAEVAPCWQDIGSAQWVHWQSESRRLFDLAASRYLSGGRDVTPDEAGRLLAGLLDVTTRDGVAIRWTRWWEAMPAWAPGDDAGLNQWRLDPPADAGGPIDLADPDVQGAVDRLLRDLAVRSDGPGALAPLTLLAMHSWACGDGAQAGVAIDRALQLDPAYRLARLAETLLRSGIAPSWVDVDRADDESAAGVPAPDIPLTG